MSKLRWNHYLSLIFITGVLLTNRVVSGTLPLQEKKVVPNYYLVVAAPVPVHKSLASASAQLAAQPFITARAAVVIDVPSAAVLFAKNADQLNYPASTTKLMTALVARDTYHLTDTLTVKQEAYTQGTVMGLQLGETMTVDNLIKGLLIHSGNDAAFVLANNHPQGYTGFVAAMNQKAEQLHLEHHSFVNPSGLDSVTQQVSAKDLAIVAKQVMADDFLRSVVGTQQVILTDTSQQISHELLTSNDLLGREEGVIGIKTGTTPLANEVLITQVQRQGRDVMLVVMGSQDRYQDTKTLIEWVFSQYQWLET